MNARWTNQSLSREQGAKDARAGKPPMTLDPYYRQGYVMAGGVLPPAPKKSKREQKRQRELEAFVERIVTRPIQQQMEAKRQSALDEVLATLDGMNAGSPTAEDIARKKQAPAEYLTRDDLMQAVGIAIEILKGSKYASDNYAAQSFLALQYGFEAVQPGPPRTIDLHKFDQIEYEQNQRIVRTALSPADADRLLKTTSPHALNRLIEAARRQGYEGARKMMRKGI